MSEQTTPCLPVPGSRSSCARCGRPVPQADAPHECDRRLEVAMKDSAYLRLEASLLQTQAALLEKEAELVDLRARLEAVVEALSQRTQHLDTAVQRVQVLERAVEGLMASAGVGRRDVDTA